MPESGPNHDGSRSQNTCACENASASSSARSNVSATAASPMSGSRITGASRGISARVFGQRSTTSAGMSASPISLVATARPASTPGDPRAPALRREERGRREREKEPFRVRRGEDERRRIQRQHENRVARGLLPDHRPRDLVERPRPDGSAGERDENAGDEVRPEHPADHVDDAGKEREECGRLLRVPVLGDAEVPVAVPLRERAEDVVGETAVGAEREHRRVGRDHPDERERSPEEEPDPDQDERHGRVPEQTHRRSLKPYSPVRVLWVDRHTIGAQS